MIISVIGSSSAKAEHLELAEEVGRELARRKVMVACPPIPLYWLALALIAALLGCSQTGASPIPATEIAGGNAAAPTSASPGIPAPADLRIRELPADWQFLTGVFPKYGNVFGVHIFAAGGVPDAKVFHAANVMAEYLDNNGDGEPDNPAVVAAMTRRNAALIMAETEAAMENLMGDLPDRFRAMVDREQVQVQDLYGSETNPADGFDASLEEVWHLISSAGYANAYPEVFGEQGGSTIAGYMDQARGGHFAERNAADCADGRGQCALPPNRQYPAGAWYTYLDPTCDYACMVTEYFYWTLTAVMGVQSGAERCREISGEWALCTPEQVKGKDAQVFNLLTDTQYALPRIAPDGSYNSTAAHPATEQ